MNEVHEPVPAQQDQPVGLETEPTESAAEQSLDLLRRERANFVNSPQLCRVITTQPDPSSL